MDKAGIVMRRLKRLAQERQKRDLAQFDEMLQKQDAPPQQLSQSPTVMEQSLNQNGFGSSMETVT
jgi:hypothetical protein